MKNPNENICFVMMSFGEPFDEYYTEIYESAIEESGFKPKRADSLFRPSPIIRDIWEYKLFKNSYCRHNWIESECNV